MPRSPAPPTPWVSFGDSILVDATIVRIEQHYKADYLADFCIRMRQQQWSDSPVAVFYVRAPKLHLGHSHYLGVYVQNGHLILTNAISITEVPWLGALAQDGEVVISRYRHDYVESRDGTAMVDGGQEPYSRCGGDTVSVWIDGPVLAKIRARRRRLGLSPSAADRGQIPPRLSA